MKAISLHQPWASLITVGAKTIETRSWAPPKALIGQRIAIHATKRMPSFDELQIMVGVKDLPDGYVRCLAMDSFPGLILQDREPAPHGKVVATVVLRCAHQVAYPSLDGSPTIRMRMGSWQDCRHWVRTDR